MMLSALFVMMSISFHVCASSSKSTNVVSYQTLEIKAFYNDIGVFIFCSRRNLDCFICFCALFLMKKIIYGLCSLLLNGIKLLFRWWNMLDQVLFMIHITTYTIICIALTFSCKYFQVQFYYSNNISKTTYSLQKIYESKICENRVIETYSILNYCSKECCKNILFSVKRNKFLINRTSVFHYIRIEPHQTTLFTKTSLLKLILIKLTIFLILMTKICFRFLNFNHNCFDLVSIYVTELCFLALVGNSFLAIVGICFCFLAGNVCQICDMTEISVFKSIPFRLTSFTEDPLFRDTYILDKVLLTLNKLKFNINIFKYCFHFIINIGIIHFEISNAIMCQEAAGTYKNIYEFKVPVLTTIFNHISIILFYSYLSIFSIFLILFVLDINTNGNQKNKND